MNSQQLATAPALGQRTTAAVYRGFGPPEVVMLESTRKPTPKAGQVLIKVHASTVSAADHRARSRNIPSGLGLLAALGIGLFRPSRKILGMDVVGVVESVGSEVTAFAPGDHVIAMLGGAFGGHAEYVCAA
ncbi:alcohol dehydrogenase catalytic domain-containing protein [Arthrobacter sp. CG_A4]|uniref:alcohol dehydrogenase catalytic domain-containing protein n=1 Tax=Arthrobacter sp. CG_A4 TaxID=3071706 RepID=UPI002E0A4902|nr:NADPH:quinone reductase-like Zn-dependent oxidoreductase [Arthrobacter sp. CG_A4]